MGKLNILHPKVFGDHLGASVGFLVEELFGSSSKSGPLSWVLFHSRSIQEVFFVSVGKSGVANS